jgi:hypothetical protein
VTYVLDVRKGSAAVGHQSPAAVDPVPGLPSPPPEGGDPAVRIVHAGPEDDLTGYLHQLRRRGPLLRSRTGWVSAHYDVATAVLADEMAFWPDPGTERPLDGSSLLAPQGATRTDAADDLPGLMFDGRPRWHSLLVGALSPTVVDTLRIDVTGWADGLVDRFQGAARLDLVDEFVAPLAGMTVGELLGVPSEDWPELQQWIEDLVPIDGTAHHRDAVRARHAVRRYLHDLLVRRRDERHDPADAAVDHLLVDGDDGTGLTQHEIGAAALALLLAGYGMVHAVVAATLHALLRHPDQVEVLLARHGSWPDAVSEASRWDPVVPLVTRRVRRSGILAGVEIASGDLITLSLAGANRDPEVFADPDILDVARRGRSRHVGFGGGTRGLVGTGIASLVAEAAARRLFERHPNARLAAEPRRCWRAGIRDVLVLPARPGRPA